MDLTALLAATRRHLDDTVTGGGAALWEDAELIDYLNRAEREAAFRAQLLQDFDDPDFCEVEIEEDERVVELDPKVIDVIELKIEGRKGCLDRTGYEQVATPINTSIGWPRAYGIQEKKGDAGHRLVFDRGFPEDSTIKISVYRYPAQAMSDGAHTPEIAEEHHEFLPFWACHLAMSKRDIDADDPEAAVRFLAMFEGRFGIRVDANVERKQRRHRPPVVRPSSYP